MRIACTLLLGVFLLLSGIPLKAQTYGPGCLPLPKNFDGKAPAPWDIDGSTADWETILGTYTGDPMNPYTMNMGNRANQALDGACKIPSASDADNPEPANDIRFMAYTYDDYNIYFYFRRPANTGGLKSFFYFLDINADGFMNEGEPVISGAFNNQTVTNLTLGYYVPNTSTDYVAGKGNYLTSPETGLVDGYTMVGSVKEVSSTRAISNNGSLEANELFGAAVTEDGYGVEFAVPWSFIKNYVQNTSSLNSNSVLLLHTALQTGGGNYTPERVVDNAGCCFGKAETVGFMGYTLQNIQGTTVVPGSKYQMSFELLNISNITERLYLDRLYLFDIQSATDVPVDLSQVQVRGYIDLNCNGTIDNNETPITLSYRPGPLGEHFAPAYPLTVETASQGKACFIAEITFPEGQTVRSLTGGFSTDVFLDNIGASGCVYILCYDGGRPINPVGFAEAPVTTRTKVYPEPTVENNYDRVVIYPNPSKGTATISRPSAAGPVDITITDFTGKVVRSFRNVSSTQFRLTDLSSGMYSVLIKDKRTGKSQTRQLVVQK